MNRSASYRATLSDPVAAQVPVAGSYSSAEASAAPPALRPPARITLPLGRRDDVWSVLAVPSGPVAAVVPFEGSYSSADVSGAPAVSVPPAMRTLPVKRLMSEGLILAT